MDMLEDDLTQHPPLFAAEPRKVHLFHDQKGAEYESMGKKHKYANTLCKGNFAGPELRTTDDPDLVTCKICRKDARFRVLLARQAVKLHRDSVVPAPKQFGPPADATPEQLRQALTLAMLSLAAIGEPKPHDPPDATICGIIAIGALVRVRNALAQRNST